MVFLLQIWKTIETADKSLMLMIDQKDYDVTTLFQELQQPPKSPHEYVKKRSDRLETEAFYVEVCPCLHFVNRLSLIDDLFLGGRERERLKLE